MKTERFKKPKYIGDPINAIRIFNEKEVDELLVIDIEATRSQRGPNFDVVEEVSGECFMPLCYGGGISHVDHATRLFASGVEKVSIQTKALQDLSLVTEIATRYGNQSVIVSVDIKKNLLGQHKLFSSSGKKTLGEDWLAFLKRAVSAGAGEILLNAVDKDGTMSGMDLPLIERAAPASSVPLIAAGGVGSLADIRAAVDVGASAISVGAFCVYHGPHRAVLITYPSYARLTELLDN